MRTLGGYIRHCRMVSNYTPFMASRSLGIDQDRLGEIERNEIYPTKSMMIQMIRTFKMDETYVKIILKRILIEERKKANGTDNSN